MKTLLRPSEPELLWEGSDRANHYWCMALQPIYPGQNCWTNRRRKVELWIPVTPLTTPLLQCGLFCALAVITRFLMVWCLGQVNGFGLQSVGVQKIGIERHPPLFKKPNRRRRYKCKIQFRYSRQTTTYNSFPLMETHRTIKERNMKVHSMQDSSCIHRICVTHFELMFACLRMHTCTLPLVVNKFIS